MRDRTRDRTDAVVALAAEGWSSERIARLLRISPRSVERCKARGQERPATTDGPVIIPIRKAEP